MKLSFDRFDLDKIFNSDEYSPKVLVELIERDFEQEYSSGVDVWEEYSLKRHTIMVLNQFEKYFGDEELPGLKDKIFFNFGSA